LLPFSSSEYPDVAETLAEFEELLSTEVAMDMERLRELSANGVPDQLRGQVWKFLLDVSMADKCESNKMSGSTRHSL
jgi:hypothetical protein